MFNPIYNLRLVPDQFQLLIASIVTLYKNKEEPQNFELYCPIANLCSASKIFDKLIIKRILENSRPKRGRHHINRPTQIQKIRSTSILAVDI
jgi:hypothetical protein